MAVYTWYPADPIAGYWIEELQAYWLATPVLGDTARPMVIFSHGGCGHPISSVYYISHIASWGFIVISTMHPGSMWGEEDCLDSASLHDTWLNRPDDISFTLDTMITLSHSTPDLFGIIDTTKMGMSGHSFGARTTYAVCSRQDWAKCGLAFSGDYTDIFGAPINCMEDIRGIDVPIMLMCGTYDLGLEPEHMFEIFDTLEPIKYAVEISRAGHFHFSDTCSSVLDPYCGADSFLNYDTAHTVIKRYATAFLFKYILDDDRFVEYLYMDYDTIATIIGETTSTVGNAMSMKIKDFTLSISPNPFNAYCKITFRYPVGEDAFFHSTHKLDFKIYDIHGNVMDRYRQIHPLNDNIFTFIWKPEKSVSSGVYFVNMEYNNVNLIERLIYVK